MVSRSELQAKVEGTVTFDGKPLSKGSVVFDPTDGKGGSSAGGIENGKVMFDSQLGQK